MKQEHKHNNMNTKEEDRIEILRSLSLDTCESLLIKQKYEHIHETRHGTKYNNKGKRTIHQK